MITSGDGTGNTEPPLGFDQWHHVGGVNGVTGVYLGDGWVIATNHGGAGDLVLDGVVYPLVPGTETRLHNPGGSLADLVLFQVFPYPVSLPVIPIRAVAPSIGELAVMVGCGRDRSGATTWDPNGEFPPPTLSGWRWGSHRTKRWGTNQVAGLARGLFLGNVALYTEFDDGQILPEAQAADGDSGGALFIIDQFGTQLAGIIYAIGPSAAQPANTALFTNLTFAARIEVYRDEILDVTSVPEPSGALPWGLVCLVALGRRKAARRRP